MELEQDVFYAELSRRISLLIMDDDELPVASYPTVSLQEFSQTINPTAQSSPYMYDQITCRRSESKGTGVFIPQSTQRRRKSRHGRSYNTKSQVQPQNNNSRGYIGSNLPNNNNYINYNCNPQYSFNNPKN